MSEHGQDDSAANLTFQWLLEKAVTYGVVISFVGTTLALISNVVVFYHWGLNFASFVTATDILIGGVTALIAATPLVVLVVIVFAIKVVTTPFSKQHKSAFTFAYNGTAAVCLALLIVLAGYITGTGPAFGKYVPTITLGTSVGFAVFLLLYLLANRLRVAPETLVLPIMLAGLAWFFVLISVSHDGQSDLLVTGKSEICPGREFVVWVGTQYVISSCKDQPYSKNDKFFVREKAGLVFRTR